MNLNTKLMLYRFSERQLWFLHRFRMTTAIRLGFYSFSEGLFVLVDLGRTWRAGE